MTGSTCGRGAVLVLALVLLAWVVLALLALGATVRLGSRGAEAGAARAAARACALAAFELALARLEEVAGPEERITGAGAFAPMSGGERWPGWPHMAAAWSADGAFVAMLCSSFPADASRRRLLHLAGEPSAGADAVVAPGIPLPVEGSGEGLGAFACFDEGAKVAVRGAADPAGGMRLRPVDSGPAAAFLPLANLDEARLRQLVVYEQLALLAPRATVRAGVRDLALEPTWAVSGGRESGHLNVNTVSPVVWQTLLIAAGVETDEAGAAASALAVAAPMAESPGKFRHGPFIRIEAVRAFLAPHLPSGVAAEAEAWARIAPFLRVRSDTFRVRAAGTWFAAGEPEVAVTARLEALVERSGEASTGRRFLVRAFRWLGPDDP